jgi:hypothetical protein
MKAISLHQPFSSLVGLGAKRFETRSWYTNYRGQLAIHAAKHWSEELKQIFFLDPFVSALDAAGIWHPAQLPKGKIVAICSLSECFSIRRDHMLGEKIKCPVPEGNERAFGDFRPGRYAWRLENVIELPEPIPFKGRQGFFNVPDDLIQSSLSTLRAAESAA